MRKLTKGASKKKTVLLEKCYDMTKVWGHEKRASLKKDGRGG